MKANDILRWLLCVLTIMVTAVAATAEEEHDALKYRRHDLALTISGNGGDSLRASFLNIGVLGGADRLHGVQLNMMTSFSRGEMHGLQLSGLSNVARNVSGMQLSAFSNVSLSPYCGFQISGVTNISRGVKRGMQLSGLTNVSSSYMRGAQIGAYNYADTLNGSQLGLINVCVSHPRGVQIGLVNYSRDTIAHKIGLVNINPNTKVDFMLFGGTSNKFNAAFRFRNRSTYNIIGFGTHYMGLDDEFSGAVFYRIGQYFNIK